MIGEIENRMLGLLRAAGEGGLLGYRYKALETYPEDWDEYLKDKDVLGAPAAWVVFAGMRAVEGPVLAPTVEMTFGLVFMAENLRNETATRHGGQTPAGAAIAGEPGSYQLAIDGFLLLAGHDLGLDIAPLEFKSLRIVSRFPALAERKVSMLAMEFTTRAQLPAIDPGPDTLPPFEVFHANWDVPPHGNVDADPGTPGVQIPADASADATDEVQLPQ